MPFTRVIPNKLEEVLLSYVKKTYLPERRNNPKTANEFTLHDIKFFSRGIAEMSEYFTSERAQLPKNYLNKKELRAGYILYFVVSNFLKIYFCLYESELLKRFKGIEEIRIADIGCGPGTASLACAEYWRGEGQRISVTAVDQNTAALHDVKRIFENFKGDNASLSTNYSFLNRKTLSYRLKGKFHVVIMANFLSEVGGVEEQASIVSQIISGNLEKNGVIIIVEPALRWTTRNLMKLRDSVASGRGIVAPCLDNRPCPMLKASDRDWCHMYLEWKRPRAIEQIDRIIGNRKDYLKFSYLILSNDASQTTNCELWRAVSSPMRTKGKIEILLCNGRELRRATRLDKNCSEANQDLDRTYRGDLVIYNGAEMMERETPFKRTYSRAG